MTKPNPVSVCVIGAGTMGRGIAQIALAAGHRVSLVDPAADQLAAAAEDIAQRLSRRQPEVAAALPTQLSTHTSVEDTPAAQRTLVVEAVLESLAVKTAVLSDALNHFGADCILATNTSSLSVTAIAAGTPSPERVVGMHFFNPVPVMRLVEVVTGLQTDPDVADEVAGLATAWGKQVARVRSAPGFIVNRVARGFYAEALRLVEEQVATPEAIDEVLRGAGQFRMGPFELMDLIGNDVNAAVTRSVWTAFNFDPRFEPSRIQDEVVAAGRYGRKTGYGFYSYADGATPARPTPVPPGAAPPRVGFGGSSAQLETLLARTGVEVDHREDLGAAAVLGDGTVLRVTRGRTAREESRALGGTPVVLVDRTVSPGDTTAIAVASSHHDTLGAVAALFAAGGIDVHEVGDAPGLVVARTLAVIINEAWETALHGVASPDDIDVAMQLGTNYPSGPFEWTRRWGAPEVIELVDALWATYHDTRYRASRELRLVGTEPTASQ
ncbi:3-hydroxyacyl-CoA dehydrogenase [Pedococcus sp. 5OH_020]|uniref:3-hydroxyacyl-CoA dehydrogenase n=1 Tax=Pedococcus sp. 5OH_020 TaxID=2989814 RepID=UPI0022E9E201|nr:3-hydroxyacyl-CoA dehydrogenase [Pedococcus sp. 5OH_020]